MRKDFKICGAAAIEYVLFSNTISTKNTRTLI